MGCKCSECPMRCQTPFSAFEGEVLEALEGSKKYRTFQAGKSLTDEDSLLPGFFCVQSGSLAYYMNRRGREYLMAVFAEGDQADISNLFSDSLSRGKLVAREDSEVCCFQADDVKKLIEESPSAALKFLKTMSQHVGELQDHLEMMAVANIESKTAAGIILLQDILGKRKWSRKELAAWTGCSTEAVIRTLTKLARDGYIAKKGRHLEIVSRPHLEALANGEPTD